MFVFIKKMICSAHTGGYLGSAQKTMKVRMLQCMSMPELAATLQQKFSGVDYLPNTN